MSLKPKFSLSSAPEFSEIAPQQLFLQKTIKSNNHTNTYNNILNPQSQQQISNSMVVQLPGSNNFHHIHQLENGHCGGTATGPLNTTGTGSIVGSQNNNNNNNINAMETSPGSSSASNADISGGGGGDAEGVWSSDIDLAFHEALQIYPPCGRRKIILSDEGKMYGRNELIARYIKLRCGKTRTRKQVSSHIQVLARKKQREVHSKVKVQDCKYDESGNVSIIGDVKPLHHQIKLSASVSPTSSCLDISTSSLNPTGTSASTSGGSSATNELISPNLGGISSSDDSLTTVTNSSNAATAALAAVARQIDTSSKAAAAAAVATWPYNVSAANSVFNNYYTASMINMNDDNFYQQFAAAAALASLPSTATLSNNCNSGTPLNTSSNLKRISQQQQHQQQQLPHPTTNLGHSQHRPEHCTIASSKLILCGFTAYIEQVDEHENRIDLVRIPKVLDDPLETIKLEDIQSKYPPILQELFKEGPSDAFFLVKCWANVSFEIRDERTALYAVDSFYSAAQNFDISVSTKVCSFGNQVVEKVEVYSPVDEDEENLQKLNLRGETSSSGPLYHFRLEKSPMCDYMVRFIAELKKLETHPLMNSVLDNFTVLQVVTNKSNNETLMVVAFIFEVSPEPESTCRIYRLSG